MWRHTGTGATPHFPIKPTQMSSRATPVRWVFILILLCRLKQSFSVHSARVGRHHVLRVWEGQKFQWKGYRGGLLLSKRKRSWQISFECCSASWDFGKCLNFIDSHLSCTKILSSCYKAFAQIKLLWNTSSFIILKGLLRYYVINFNHILIEILLLLLRGIHFQE